MEKFSYQPIAPPDEIRMIEIVPGAASDPIHVRLIHKRLSDMPYCIALSYEWGSRTRDFEIICNGAILKVTENLVKALERLRGFQTPAADQEEHADSHDQGLSITERTLFWIDAIAINQEDLNERSQQVPLMSSIYTNALRVIVWLGEELTSTRDAWKLMEPLSDRVDDFEDFTNSEIEERYRSTELSPGLTLGTLQDHPLFAAVVDLFASRTVFQRLWTLQELCLARHATVLCGSVAMDWIIFGNIALVLFKCQTIWYHDVARKINTSVLLGVYIRRHLTGNTPLGGENLLTTFLLASNLRVSDRRDCVFGTLGMFDDETREIFADLGYRNTDGEVFRAATKAIIASSTDEGLEYLAWTNVTRDRSTDPKLPSWVWILEHRENGGYLQPPPTVSTGHLEGFHTATKPVICEDILMAQGLIFDHVTFVFANFTPENFEAILMDIRFGPLVGTNNYPKGSSPGVLGKLAYVVLRLYLIHGDIVVKQLYESWVASVALREWEKVELEDQEIESWRGMPVSTLRERTGSYDNKQTAETDRSIRSFILREDQDGKLTGEGRNIFFTSKGYCGIGVYGKTGPGCDPVVQVDDKIAILPGVVLPVVLRRFENFEYRFVGPAFIPDIETDDSLQPGNRKEMEEIRII